MKKVSLILVIFIIWLILIRMFVLSIWNIPGKVMYPLIHSNQKVLVLNKRWFKPKRGDIVIVRFEKRGRSYIRRIIGMEGDTLSIRDNVVSVNGKILNEPYKFIDSSSKKCSFLKTMSLTIPMENFFVMGDNRCIPSDFDSRVDGTINRNQIVGKVVYIF